MDTVLLMVVMSSYARDSTLLSDTLVSSGTPELSSATAISSPSTSPLAGAEFIVTQDIPAPTVNRPRV